MRNENRIILALDVDNITNAKNIISNIKYDIIYKVGMEFFYSFGVHGINELKKIKPGMKLFLDLKLHDIPNTVSKAIVPLILKVKPYMITLHVSGGKRMLEMTVKSVNSICKSYNLERPILLGVTILTSLDKEDLKSLDWGTDLEKTVIKLARMAIKSGLDGVVCSPKETKYLKATFKHLKIVTPGIRFKKEKSEDQSRVMSPAEALKLGADYIVLGRSILNAENKNEIIEAILKSLKSKYEN